LHYKLNTVVELSIQTGMESDMRRGVNFRPVFFRTIVTNATAEERLKPVHKFKVVVG